MDNFAKWIYQINNTIYRLDKMTGEVMKEHDKVKVIKDRKSYLTDGIKVGSVGYIIYGVTGDSWLVQFFNDDMSDSIISSIRSDDLEVIPDEEN